jgi:hypothetical protein
MPLKSVSLAERVVQLIVVKLRTIALQIGDVVNEANDLFVSNLLRYGREEPDHFARCQN